MKQSKELKVAISAATAAGRILMKRWGKVTVSYKQYQDMVTVADTLAEKAIVGLIKKNFPSHAIYSEEMGSDEKKSDYIWVIDPLDGTTNFVMHNPFFNTAISLVYKGEVILGVVHAPFLKEMYWAEKGKGAFMNNKRIHVSKKNDLSRIIAGFCHNNSEKARKRITKIFANVKRSEIKHYRQFGSGELELAYVAISRLDSYNGNDQQLYDIAAGALLVTEAGGKVTDFDGLRWKPGFRNILASNGIIHKKMLNIINKK